MLAIKKKEPKPATMENANQKLENFLTNSPQKKKKKEKENQKTRKRKEMANDDATRARFGTVW